MTLTGSVSSEIKHFVCGHQLVVAEASGLLPQGVVTACRGWELYQPSPGATFLKGDFPAEWLPRWHQWSRTQETPEMPVRSLGQQNPLWIRQWPPSAVFLPGKSHGQRILAGYSPWGRKESDMTEHSTHTPPLGMLFSLKKA